MTLIAKQAYDQQGGKTFKSSNLIFTALYYPEAGKILYGTQPTGELSVLIRRNPQEYALTLQDFTGGRKTYPHAEHHTWYRAALEQRITKPSIPLPGKGSYMGVYGHIIDARGDQVLITTPCQNVCQPFLRSKNIGFHGMSTTPRAPSPQPGPSTQTQSRVSGFQSKSIAPAKVTRPGSPSAGGSKSLQSRALLKTIVSKGQVAELLANIESMLQKMHEELDNREAILNEGELRLRKRSSTMMYTKELFAY